MCSCWDGSFVMWWFCSCKHETVVDVSKGAKPVKSLYSASIKRNSGLQVVSGSEGTDTSALKLEEKLWQDSNVRIFAYSELKTATRNFRADSALGEGGFGIVYKGCLDDTNSTKMKVASGTMVAVKVFNQEGLQGHREWLAEVNFLGQLEHPHLVKLIGYCCEEEHRMLVYEFMPCGSLENHLFRKTIPPLPWETRMKIALGAAKGLAFLHGAETSIIYRDFKTSNILLDSDYTAKLSDFGLAKDGPEGDQTHVSTRIMGTYGYAAPEYVMTGRRSMDKKRPTGEQSLVEWARACLLDKRKLPRIIDPRLGQYSVKGAQKTASLAYYCLSQNPKARPLMSDVVETLKPLQNMRDMANGSYTLTAGAGIVNHATIPNATLNGNNTQSTTGQC